MSGKMRIPFVLLKPLHIDGSCKLVRGVLKYEPRIVQCVYRILIHALVNDLCLCWNSYWYSFPNLTRRHAYDSVLINGIVQE